jgi:hypothetical protein
MTPPYPVHIPTADTTHAKASAAKRLRSNGVVENESSEWIVASLDRKRLGQDTSGWKIKSPRGVFDKETRRKPLAFAADAVCYGI